MSGPIVRLGAVPGYWENWDEIFGDKNKKNTDKKKTRAKAPKKPSKKPAKKSAGKQ